MYDDGYPIISIYGIFELKFDDSRICAGLPCSSFLLKKTVFLKIVVPNLKILFSLQNLLKVLNNAVILLCRSLESVHGARRTKQKRISRFLMVFN